MLDWILKKNAVPAPAESGAAAPPAIDWPRKLQAALGDDAALLALARENAPVDLKLAAVGALAGEAALKQAERDHRDHDRRVHRLAKQRHLAQVAVREAGEQAAVLIASASALLGEPVIAANRLVALDHAWRALDATLLDAAQRGAFEALQAQLSALTRERGDRVLEAERRAAEARQAIAQLQAACADCAAGTQDRGHLAAAGLAAHGVLASASDDALRGRLDGVLLTAAQLDEHLAVLDELLKAAPDGAAVGAGANLEDAALRWKALAPLADVRLGAALSHRFEQWQRARDDAREDRGRLRRERDQERERARREDRSQALATTLERAEAALAAGHLADTGKHLAEVDELLHGGAHAGALRARIDTLQAEVARLAGWQRWGGGRARDELVLQAEALAAAVGGAAQARTVKLSIKQQAELIDDMRARWKELDRLGGAGHRSLWQRFDVALESAHAPVAAHREAQRAVRAQNLQAREQLVAVLEAAPLPDAPDDDAAAGWKSLAMALEHFHSEWRKLGPIEHTVPHQAREPLVERMGAALLRLETPLNEARRGARGVREQLIDRARALGAEAAAGAPGRELLDTVRDLQARWQHSAKALPLARPVEKALWAEFRGAVDAVFSAQDAVFHARDAQFKVHAAERAALIERLAALTADTLPAELARTLAEVEAQWERAGPAPRGDAAALDARFRGAHAAVRRHLAGSARRRWHASCDAMLAKLALCEALEDAAGADEARAAFDQGWAAQPELPAPWEQVLARRAAPDAVAAKGGSALGTASTDELLLQLELAHGLDSPAASQAARREMKLQAMKAALEGRSSVASAPPAAADLLLAVLGRPRLDDLQRTRLRTVVAALRQMERSP